MGEKIQDHKTTKERDKIPITAILGHIVMKYNIDEKITRK
jgi:hypothetical protein